jgi:hypothetical protein
MCPVKPKAFPKFRNPQQKTIKTDTTRTKAADSKNILAGRAKRFSSRFFSHLSKKYFIPTIRPENQVLKIRLVLQPQKK